MKNMKTQKRLATIIRVLLLVILALLFALPLYIALVNAFKVSDRIVHSPLSFPIPFVLDNIIQTLTTPNVNVWAMYLNSFILVISGVIITLVVSIMASYYMARSSSRFAQGIRVYFLVGIMVPYVIVFIPLCILFRKLGIPFSVPSLILVFVSGNIPFATFMYTNYIRALPHEIEEAAAIDGANAMGTLTEVVFPLLRPCTASVIIITALSIWNDFMTPLLLGQVKTITVGIYTAIGPYSANWGVVFSYVLLASIPVVILFLCFQNQFISGLTSGAIKG